MKSLLLALAIVVTASSPVVATQSPDRVIVQFASDSDEVPAASLAELARFARAHPDRDFSIEGHAILSESDNSPNYAIGLSHRRANRVRAAIWNDDFERWQLSRSRTMIVSAYGASRPLAGAAPTDGRNRRVEVMITESATGR
ncbi:OmpA family protein [Brevundimonas goettingensis]|uniref:OmpA family protein n=1 Tax=Brevundimonas goettingensis TaxID=2774190 RepID=A0A975C2P0_9CAUL|nr:OmpA family protein [Brevundimonas goettingensis]QTC90457.1 OmpA family protein [Brevundimonas goettingensis]